MENIIVPESEKTRPALHQVGMGIWRNVEWGGCLPVLFMRSRFPPTKIPKKTHVFDDFAWVC